MVTNCVRPAACRRYTFHSVPRPTWAVRPRTSRGRAAMGRQGATYYDILRVSRGAAPEGVRRAYRSLAQRYHPDKLQGRAEAVRVMAALNEAYAVLSDPDQRARYDRAITRASRRAAQPVELREAAWPWWLLFATIAFAVCTIGTVAWRMVFPSVTMGAVQAGATKPPPARPVQLTRN